MPILPGTLALREDPKPRARPGRSGRSAGSGTARQASGSRKACSTGWVRKRLVDDVGGVRQRPVDVADLDLGGRQQVARLVDRRCVRLEGGQRVQHGRQHLVLDLDQGRRFAGRVPGLGGDHRQHVAHVPGRLALGDEQRPVLEDQALVPLARDVPRGGDPDDAGDPLGDGRVDPLHDRARVGRQDDRAVEHPGDDHVANEGELAQDEVAAVVAIGPGAHAGLGAGRPEPARSPRLTAATVSSASSTLT